MKPFTTLQAMLTERRPAGSKSDRRFTRRWLLSLPGAWQDDHGNTHLVIPRADGSPSRVLWSAHTDTVHRQGGKQSVICQDGYLQLAPGSDSNCLGADNTAGVWLLREMALARVPGHYIWHYGEEQGCIGSQALALACPDYMLALDYAIAFDRRGTSEVITHQMYGRSASDSCAWSIADALRSASDYSPSDRGVYTDTASYVDIIPECTNVSVGTENEHRSTERLDIRHIWALRTAMIRFDETSLVCEREPSDPCLDDNPFARYEAENGYGPPVDGYDDRSDALDDEWDYGTYAHPDLSEDDKAILREMGWATRRRWRDW